MMDAEHSQYPLFKDCIARRIISRFPSSLADDPADTLDEFASYISSETWLPLPEPYRVASYGTPLPDALAELDDSVHINIPPAVSDSLVAYSLASDWDEAHTFVVAALRDYVADATTPPPVWSSTRTDACELCARDVPLTYHHLIPRSMHEKVRKRRWHPIEMLDSVAWLCRPCHSAVHHAASNEELARSYYTLELLLQREDIQRWRAYAAKQRWGARRG